ncbi:MlaD family protein [Aquicella lusitana]|nr:MlaD family protein [Aquicella lusitana]
METKVNYTIVGAFVIALVGAITLSVIWLSSGFSFERYSIYMVYMKESVTGLNIDSPVEYNGVDVGSVKSIEINHKNPQMVEVLINIKSATPITMGTTAMLSTRGVTGVSFIALQDKSTDLRPLEIKQGQTYPVIKTVPSIFMRLDAALSKLSENFGEISQAFQSVFDKENLQSIKGILSNLDRVTGTLAINNRKLEAILANTAKATQQLTPLMRSSTSAMRVIETQTLPAAYQVLSNLDDVARTLAEVSAEVKQNPSVILRGVDRQVLGPGETR